MFAKVSFSLKMQTKTLTSIQESPNNQEESDHAGSGFSY